MLQRLFLLLFIAITSLSQAQVIQQDLAWLRYFNKTHLTEKWELDVEIEERRYINPERIHQRLIPRAALNRKLNEHLEANVGFTYFQFYAPNDPTLPAVRSHELRPHQFLAVKNTFGRLTLKQRFMVEERFFRRSAGASSNYLFNMRLRTTLGVSLALIRDLGKSDQGGLSVVLFDEWMVQGGEGIALNVFDQNRLFAGMHADFSDRLGMELGYMNWYHQRVDGISFYNRNIVRLTLIHHLYI